MKNLVLVESPSKAKTIKKYLGKDYTVMATVGHIIDLPKSKLGVDLEKGYEPQFATIKGKGSVINKIKKSLPKDGKVLLATDPDREGEAIAWHAQNALKLDDADRIVFHEITKSAIESAIAKPRKVDMDLVNAQIARRVLDRLVGYKVSEVLWEKIWYGLSAGRVQSAALRLIVEREREIEAFIPEEYWKFFADIIIDKDTINEIELIKRNGKKYKPGSEEDVNQIKKDIDGKQVEVVDVSTKEVSKSPYPPFTTSTLQQSANNLFGYTAKRTMALAQALYQAGYITYMRTDSVNLSNQARENIRKLIGKEFGGDYLPEKPKFYKTKSKSAQEAHEAIRPTDFSVGKSKVQAEFSSAHAKLYELIWKRSIASQMSNQRSERVSVKLDARGDSGDVYQFKMGAEKVLFDGFRKVFGSSTADQEQQVISKNIKVGDFYDVKELRATQHFTQPKPRYTDASLVKALEEYGIGRPSTYATIISTVQDRGYVEKRGRNLHPLDVGRVVSKFLEDNFSRLVDYEYTAGVEDKLDSIAEGKAEYEKFIDNEFKPLVGEIDKTKKEVDKEDVVILAKSDEKCDECGSEMVVRLGRYGKFLSCSRFPECKGMKSIEGGEEELDEKYYRPEKCPECGKEMELKTGKYGKFWACVTYPECKGTLPMLLQEKCPECGERLVERKSRWGKVFIGCSGYPDCKYIQKQKKKGEEDEE